MAFVFTPLLEGMSAAARFAWPHIVRAAEEGLGSEQIITALKEGGIPTFRRQDMLALIREATGGELLKSDIRRWPKDVLFPIERVRASVTKIVAPFSYTLRVKVADEDGRESYITRQAHSRQLRSMEDVAANFLESAPAFEQYQGVELLSAEVIDIQRAGEQGVL